MKIDILKVVDEVDRLIFRRLDMTEAELKVASATSAFTLALTSVCMIVSIRKLNKLQREVDKLKIAKGE